MSAKKWIVQNLAALSSQNLWNVWAVCALYSEKIELIQTGFFGRNNEVSQ